MNPFLKTFSSIYQKDWEYINIDYDLIHQQFNWIRISHKLSNHIYPGSHQTDIQKLFLLCICFKHKTDFIKWSQKNLDYNFNTTQLRLVDLFCYSSNKSAISIEEKINHSHNETLLHFILLVLDRALIWYDPSYSYPSELKSIIKIASQKLFGLKTHDLRQRKKPNFISNSLNVIDTYNIGAFLKFETLINEIPDKEISYDIKVLAYQAHETLLNSINDFLGTVYSPLCEIDFEQQLENLKLRESNWCFSLLD